MVHRSLRVFKVVFIVICLLSFNLLGVFQTQAAADGSNSNADGLLLQTGSLYTQPVDTNGKLFLSSWLDPDGSDNDQYVWDSFTLPSNGMINAIDWYGGYDPLMSGKGGPVTGFTLAIYSSIAAGTEPAVANPPLVKYQIGGNAGETSIGMVGGATIYAYTFNLPAPFAVSAGVKYWVQIEAFQQGSIPDWCFVAGSSGDGSHYLRTSGAGGDILYRTVPGDVAFTLLGSVEGAMTPTPMVTETSIPAETATTMPTDTPAPTPVPQIPTCLGSIATFMILAIFFSDFRTTKR